MSARGRNERRGRAVSFACAVMALTLGLSVAWAYWTAGSVPGGGGASAATSVGRPSAPSASPSGSSVTVAWSSTTLGNGQPATGYTVQRYSSTAVSQTVGAGCSGTRTGLICTESSVPDGQWTYTVTARFATSWIGPESPASTAVTVDTTAPTNALSLSSVTGGAYLTGTSVYYRGSDSGSFALSNAVSDAGSAPQSSSTSAFGGSSAGWTHTPSTVSTPAGGPFVSAPFSWTAGTSSGPTEAVTGRDARGNSVVTTLSYVDDVTAPTVGTVSYPDGYQPRAPVTVSFTAGTDAGSGVSTAASRLSRSVAPMTDGVCGTYTTDAGFAVNPTWPFVDSTVAAGNCYTYAFVTIDNVGNSSTATSASVAKITSGASYDFEEGAGTTAADGTGNSNTATLQPGAGWTTGVVNARALNLTGASSSWASSAGPVVDTSKSFTVAGWVRLNSTSGYQTIASIDGSSVSPFYLQKADDGLFTFGTHSTDSTAATFQSAKGVTPTTGTWYHLAGIYDAAASSISLYVNGSLQQTTTGVSMFQATGATTLGRAKYNGNVDFVNGAIDDVRFYDRTLSAGQISTLYGLGDLAGPAGGSVDATGLTGTGSRYATSTTLSLALAKGTDASGLATSGNLLQRSTATLTGGTCGTYGTPTTVATDPGATVSDTVADGACYRYGYTVSDTHANATTYTSGDVKVDTTAPAAPTLAFSALTNAYASGSVLYYRSATTGSFTVTASATDALSGIASYGFPSLGTGWTATPGSTGVTTYSWTASPTAPGAKTVTATNNAALTSPGTTFTPTADDAGPTGGSISYPDGATSASTVAVTSSSGTDAGSGIVSTVLQRSTATYNGSSCAGFGGFTTIATNPSSPYTDTPTAGACYQYRLVVTDNVGNSSTVTSSSVARVTTGATYDFEEGAGSTSADSTGNNNTLTLQSGAGWTTGVDGGKALSVNGATGSWASSAGPTIDSSSSFSVAGWVRFNDITSYDSVAGMDGTAVSPFYLQQRFGQFAFETYGADRSGGSSAIALGGTATTGRWYQVTGVYDATAHTATLYVNGTAVATATGASTFKATGPTTVGRAYFNSGPVDFVNGAIDDVRFVNRVLTQTEVRALIAAKDSAGPTGGSVDATGLTGTGSRYSTSTTLSLALATGTDPSGVASSGSTLRRATATLSGGSCGTYGAPTTVTTDPGATVSDTVTDGACYRYSYVVSDAQGNPTTYTSPDIKVDATAPAAPTLAFSALTNAYASGSVLYYRSATTGSVTLTASASDAAAGIASYSFPSLGTGWTSTPGATGVTTYSWTASPAAPGSRSVTATDNASLTSAGATFTPTADDAGPTGGSITYPDGAVNGSTVTVTFAAGTDSGSGIGSTVLQRSSALYDGATCGSFGTFTTVAGGTAPTSPFTDTPPAEACYQYRLLVTDNVGTTTTVTSTNAARVTTGASYGFEEGSGTTAADGTGNGNPLTLQSGAGWTAGRVGSQALNLSGSSSSWASSAGPVVDTSKSFTVAGWVKFTGLDGYQTIASQDGVSVSPFYLQRRGDGLFAFGIFNTDSTSGFTAGSAGVSPVVGTWYHITGVYDATARTATLYVNGVSQGAATGVSPFKATGAAAVGRSKFGGGNTDFVNGAIDDVRFLGRPLSASEVAVLAAG